MSRAKNSIIETVPSSTWRGDTARGAQHAEQLVIGGDDGNAHVGPELEVLGHLAVGMGLGEVG